MRAAQEAGGDLGGEFTGRHFSAESGGEAKSNYRPRLLTRMREALRSRHYSRRTEQTYCSWVKRFIFFHNVRHPAEMGEPEINAFLTYLAVKGKVSASTQNQALSALLFLYRHVDRSRSRRSGRTHSCPQAQTPAGRPDTRRS